MRLYARAIKNYANVNNFSYQDQWTIRAGDPNTLYFQLIDLDQVSCDGKEILRYIPGVGLSNQPVAISVTFPSIDDENQITVNATAVDSADGSLWKVELSASQIPGSGNVQFSIGEGSAIRRFGVMAMMAVEYSDSNGSC